MESEKQGACANGGLRSLQHLFTLVLLLLLPGLLRAQEIIITLNIVPPYPAYAYNYADLTNQALITLTNTTQELKEVRLEGSMTNGTANLFVRTEPGHRGPQPIMVPAGGSVVLSSQPGLMDFLDPQVVTINADDAVQRAIVQTGQLPEGVYRLCVEAYDYNGTQLLSQPGGGCFSFGLYYANPPIITQPVNGTEVSAYMTNPVFTWTPPLGNLAGAIIEYDLLVTPVFPGQNPNDAIIAARTYQRAQPVLLKEGLMTNVYVRQVFDLAFEHGKQYAMQVTARDRNGVVGISNLGRSEISVFTVGTVDTPVTPYSGTAPVGAPIIDPGISPVFTENTLRGKLHYFWHNASNHGATSSAGSGGTLNIGANSGVISGTSSSGAQQAATNSTDGNRAGYSSFTQQPLAGVTVQLVQGLQFQNAPGTGPIASPLLPGLILQPEGSTVYVQGQPSLSLPVLATATTDAQGNFVFNVPNVQSIDFGWKQGTVSTTAAFSGEFNNSYTGTFRRVLMVRVGNPARTYYAQPVQYNNALPATGDLGPFYAQVKSYDVKVLVAEQTDFMLKKPNLEVLLLRKVSTKPTQVPKDEASRGDLAANPTITISLQQYEILARDTTNAQGMAEFRDLVRFDCATNSSNNLYYTWARPVDAFTTQWSQSNWPQPINYAYQGDWAGSCFNAALNSLTTACTKCNLSMRDGFGTYSSAHPRAFKGQDEWLYHVNRTFAAKPAITATTKNYAAGTQSDLALNEPGVMWKLWRLNEAAMLHAKSVISGGAWGASAEGYEPEGFNMLQAVLSNAGKPMVLETFGITGSNGRIEARNLPVEGTFTQPKGHYYILDVSKTGFGRRIKVVNRLPAGNAAGLLGSGTGSVSASGDVGLVRPGYQYNAGEIWLNPSGRVTLVLQNEAGASVSASAYYIDPATGQEGQIVASTYNALLNRRQVIVDLPSGSNRRIVVVPNDLDAYERDTVIVPSVPNTGTITQTAIIPFKLHRVHFTVHGEPSSPQVVLQGQDPEAVGPLLAGARVELIGTNAVLYPNIAHPATAAGGTAQASPSGQPLVRYTNNSGMVDFAVKMSSGEPLSFRVYAPATGSYVTHEVYVSTTPGKRWSERHVQLKRGRTVQGRVTIDSAAVAGAKVRYTYMGITAEATTNAAGEYTLANVPKQPLTFTASKQAYLGMEYTEGQASQGAFGAVNTNMTLAQMASSDQPTTLNFQLRIYGGMDFSRILGFPLEVTAFAEEPNGRARINGWVTVPDSANAVFRLTQASSTGNDLRSVRFLNTVVEPDVAVNAIGVALTKPVTLPMTMAVNEVAVGMYPQKGQNPYAYHATLRDPQQGIALDRPAGNDTRGAVMGQVRVAVASFTDNNFTLAQGEAIHLAAPGGGQRLATFASDASSWYGATQAMNVTNAQGQPFSYQLHGFQASSITNGSLLYRDSLVLDTRIHTVLANIPAPDNDLNLAIGTIKLVGGQLQPFSSARSFTVPLGQFSLQGTQLSMNNSGFGFKGTLMASGMELAVEHGALQPTSFALGAMTASNMKLMGVIPVTATKPAQFGYDAVRPQPAWYVVVTSGNDNETGASISGQHLDGVPNDRDVPITSIWLYSNGAQEVSLRNNIPSYRLYGITDFHPQSMTIAPNLLTLSGELDLGIPDFPTYTSALLYDKVGSNLSAFRLQDFAMPPSPVNGVQIAFNKGPQRGSYGMAGNQGAITFAQGQLTIKGVISDQDPNVFKNLAYTLVKTNTLTKLTVDRDPQQSMRLGGDNPGSRILMTDVEGEMKVVTTNGTPGWNHFYVKGNMPDAMGFEAQNGQPQRMRFEVRGDLAVEDQQVKLKDIETPFGNINMVYDMQYQRLSGQLNVSHAVSGGPSMSGSAAIVIDRDGFYFMSGLNVNLADPKITGMAFILLGDYKTRTPEMDALMMQYSLHVQKKMERQIPAFLVPVLQQLLVQSPATGVSMANGLYGGDLLPPTYLGLFTNGGRFNGFYFEAGAQIPLPVIPNFSIDCSPIATLEMGCDGGIDVRFGANFGAGSFGVGFDTYVDIYMAGGASAGIICAYGRIGLYLSVGLDGVFNVNGNYTITGNGNVQLAGNVTIGGGMCSIPCNDVTCLHFDVGGTINLGMQALITNNGSDFHFTMGSNTTGSTRHDPPPQEN